MSCVDRCSPFIQRVKSEAHPELPSLQYCIQFIDESLVEEAVAFMIENFLPNDNMDKAIGSSTDAETVAAYYFDWKMHLRKGISLAAFIEDHAGNRGRMIACCVLDIDVKPEKAASLVPLQNLAEKFKLIYRTLDEVMAKRDVFTLYNCDKIIMCYGLTTLPELQRRGIGTAMLRARAQVSKLLNIPVSASVFDGEASQKTARRCGYETLAELDLTTYRIDGKIVYPHPSWHIIKWMAIRYY